MSLSFPRLQTVTEHTLSHEALNTVSRGSLPPQREASELPNLKLGDTTSCPLRGARVRLLGLKDHCPIPEGVYPPPHPTLRGSGLLPGRAQTRGGDPEPSVLCSLHLSLHLGPQVATVLLFRGDKSGDPRSCPSDGQSSSGDRLSAAHSRPSRRAGLERLGRRPGGLSAGPARPPARRSRGPRAGPSPGAGLGSQQVDLVEVAGQDRVAHVLEDFADVLRVRGARVVAEEAPGARALPAPVGGGVRAAGVHAAVHVQDEPLGRLGVLLRAWGAGVRASGHRLLGQAGTPYGHQGGTLETLFPIRAT